MYIGTYCVLSLTIVNANRGLPAIFIFRSLHFPFRLCEIFSVSPRIILFVSLLTLDSMLSSFDNYLRKYHPPHIFIHILVPLLFRTKQRAILR